MSELVQETKSLSILSMSPIPSKADWSARFISQRWTDSLVDTIFNILLSSPGPLRASVVKLLGSGLLCFWHRLDQQRERLAEA